MTTNAPVMYQVIDGPGIQETIDSFTWAFSGSQRPVTFRVMHMLEDSRYEILVDAIVTAIKYESGAPGLFILEFQRSSMDQVQRLLQRPLAHGTLFDDGTTPKLTGAGRTHVGAASSISEIKKLRA